VVSESSHWDFIVAMVAANIGVALLPVTICRRPDRRQVLSVNRSRGGVWRCEGSHAKLNRAHTYVACK
jgi:DNA-binding transcriptional LysR family regulator